MRINFSRLDLQQLRSLAKMAILTYYDREGYTAALELILDIIKDVTDLERRTENIDAEICLDEKIVAKLNLHEYCRKKLESEEWVVA